MASERENGGIRQAAILMASVDSQTARQLLQQMPPATAKAVRKAMVDLGRIDAEEQKAVLAAFKARVQPPKSKTVAANKGQTQPNSLQRQEVGGQGNTPSHFAGNDLNSNSSVNSGGPFGGSYWDQYSADQIIEVVTAERPTVIAVVLTQLQPSVANQILGKLQNELRKEVLIQLSRLQHVEAEIIQEIKDQLQQKLAYIRPTPYVDQEMGMNRLKSILEAGDEQMKVELCQAIQEANELNGPLRYWVKEQLHSLKKTNSSKESSQESAEPQTSATTASTTQIVPTRQSSHVANPAGNSGHSHSDSPHSQIAGQVFDTAHSYVDFEDLKWIGLNQLAMILQNCDPRAMLVALSTADDELLSRVAMLFSKKDWKRLNERLKNLGTVDDEDRLAARMIVAETAQRLLIGDDLNGSAKPVGDNMARAA